MNKLAFTEQFSTRETADILHHFKFKDWERSAMREGVFVVPRGEVRGRAGAEYGYAHLVERSIHISMTAAYERATMQAFCFGMFKLLEREILPSHAYQDVMSKLPFADLGFEPEKDRYGFSGFVHSPEIPFSEAMISRDRERPTIALFLPAKIKTHTRSVRLLNDAQDVTTKDIRRIAIEMATAGVSDERTRYVFAEEAIIPSLVDLTEILCRLDENIDRILKARARNAERVVENV